MVLHLYTSIVDLLGGDEVVVAGVGGGEGGVVGGVVGSVVGGVVGNVVGG